MEYAPRQCIICGKNFVPCMSTQKTCSQECSRKNKNRPNPTPKVGYFELKTWEVECMICGRKFTARCQRQPKYCSEKCRQAAHNGKRKYTYEKKDKTEKTCVICGTKFLTYQFEKAKYCSPHCANKANSGGKKYSMVGKEDYESRFDPQPRKCPGLPWYRCNKQLAPDYPKYRCPDCDKKWRIKYGLHSYDSGAINDE